MLVLVNVQDGTSVDMPVKKKKKMYIKTCTPVHVLGEAKQSSAVLLNLKLIIFLNDSK